MGLAVQDQRIHRAADIVDRGVAVDPGDAGLGIDLDLADMPAVGIGADPAVDIGLVGDRPALGRQRQKADAAVGAGDGEAAVGEDDVCLGRFELLGGELAALGDDAERGLVDRGRGQPDRAAGMRAAAHRQAVAVVGDEAHLVGRHAQPFAGELGEAGGMALPGRQRADHDLDRPSGSTVTSARSAGAPLCDST